jgi:hypothetical protein
MPRIPYRDGISVIVDEAMKTPLLLALIGKERGDRWHCRPFRSASAALRPQCNYMQFSPYGNSPTLDVQSERV